jgi:hypothetical protein
MVILASSVFRHAFYETFLHVHQLLAVLFLGAANIHVNGYKGYVGLMKGIMAVWIIEVSHPSYNPSVLTFPARLASRKGHPSQHWQGRNEVRSPDPPRRRRPR